MNNMNMTLNFSIKLCKLTNTLRIKREWDSHRQIINKLFYSLSMGTAIKPSAGKY